MTYILYNALLMAIPELNIKRDHPTVEVARERLIQEIARAKKSGVTIVKVIHGYGSTGVGGTLREEMREQLSAMLKSRAVKQVLPGEDFNMFNRATADLTGRYPELLNDDAYNRSNKGITLVVL